jgi:spore coat protein CotF
LLNQNQQGQMQAGTNMPPQQNFGGHELMEVHESLGGVVGTLEHFVIAEQYVQDPELSGIMQRQKGFISQMYNTILDTLKSGQDPAVKTQTYEMQENNQTTYGMTPSTPKAPITSVGEINDQCVSSALLGHLKGMATHFTTTALESSNPVLRRIFADSVPNIIEMAFETFLYQNKHQYYQVPQLPLNDMQAIINAHAPVSGTMPH